MRRTTNLSMTIPTGAGGRAGINHLDEVWASLSDGDKQVLLGHSRPTLSGTEKARLASVARAQRQTQTGRRARGRRRPA